MANSHGKSTVSIILYPLTNTTHITLFVHRQNKISFTDHVNMLQLNKVTRNLPSTCTFEKTEKGHMFVDLLPAKFHLNDQLLIQDIRTDDSKFSDDKEILPRNIYINFHKLHKLYIQSRLSETEGQTNLYIEHSGTFLDYVHASATEFLARGTNVLFTLNNKQLHYKVIAKENYNVETGCVR